MRNLLMAVTLGSVLTLGCVYAQYGDPYGRDPYNRDYRGGGTRYDRGDPGFGLIQQVQADLQRAGAEGRRPVDFRRVDNAVHHLSEFDYRLRQGRFDKGKLDRAINDLHNVIYNNAMDRHDRRTLENDIERLRDFRARYDAYRDYRYR